MKLWVQDLLDVCGFSDVVMWNLLDLQPITWLIGIQSVHFLFGINLVSCYKLLIPVTNLSTDRIHKAIITK